MGGVFVVVCFVWGFNCLGLCLFLFVAIVFLIAMQIVAGFVCPELAHIYFSTLPGFFSV